MAMDKYIFENDQFGVSEKGVHFLRSRFNYETFNFSEIREISISKEYETENWGLLLLTGVIFLIVSVYYEGFVLMDYYVYRPEARYYIEQFTIPMVTIMFGIYCIVNSLRKGMVIRFHTSEKTKRVLLEDKKVNSEELLAFLKSNSPEELVIVA